MEWTECISTAIDYIEANLTEEITIEDIAGEAMVSPFYFQKGFAMLCGFTVGDYLKKRRLALAGSELMATDAKIIDLALKYGYDSPDSFTKAFTRFHGLTPSAVRKGEGTVKSFAPLKIKLILEGGSTMDYKIVQKEQFTIVGVANVFKYGEAAEAVPKMWAEFSQSPLSQSICPLYGVNIDEEMGRNSFEYLIADNFDPTQEVPAGAVTKTIPAFTWAVFPCHGPMPQKIQSVNEEIFSQWLPGNTDYEIAAGYNIEMYADPAKYPQGTADKDYYCEVWIPVRRK